MQLYRKFKLALLIAIGALIAILSGLLFYGFRYPDFEERKIPVYSYNSGLGINYQIFMKPNILYDRQTIDEQYIYISEYMDYIKLLFKYDFTGERAAEIKGDYEVVASVEGYNNAEKSSEDKTEENVRTIWKKDFPLMVKTSFETNKKSLSITREILVAYGEFNDFAQKVIDSSKVNTPVKLTVYININLDANTDKGLIKEKLSPSIVLPLNTNYFEITKNEVKEKTGSIEETRRIQLPINMQKVYLYSGLLGIMLLGLLYVIIFTSGTKKVDPYIKNLNKIFKNHGSRLVALNSDISASYDRYCGIRSMEDLVRVADELEKPIMYEYSPDPRDITQFYVFEETCMYLFDLKKSMGLEETEELLREEKDITGQVQQNATLAP